MILPLKMRRWIRQHGKYFTPTDLARDFGKDQNWTSIQLLKASIAKETVEKHPKRMLFKSNGDQE